MKAWDQALASDSNDPIGRRLFNQDFQDLYTDDDPYLEPNKSVDFRIKVKVADLALSDSDGVYLMGVHVLQDTANVAIGRSRIFVPMVASEPERPLKMTSIAILDSRPSMISKGLLSDDHLAEEVSSKGRLTALLDAVDAQDMTFAVDPALIEELQTMRAGYQVRRPDAGTVTGTGQAAAARWLDDFANVKADHDGYRLLFGSPDLAALTHDGQRAPIRASVASNKLVPLTSSLPLLVFPAAGAADAATMATAASPAAGKTSSGSELVSGTSLFEATLARIRRAVPSWVARPDRASRRAADIRHDQLSQSQSIEPPGTGRVAGESGDQPGVGPAYLIPLSWSTPR